MLIRDAPVFILWKWPVAGALCDVSDHLLLFFTGVPYRRTLPLSKYKERVRDKFSGKRELAHRSSPMACAAVLGKARGARSHEDRRFEQVGRPLVHSSPCHGGRVKAAGGLPAKVGTTRRSCKMDGQDGLGFWSQRISLWISENCGWSTREGWHDSPAVRGEWPGWTASGHSTSRHGEVKTAGGLPAKVGTTCLSCGVW
ncbi:hypothetical protein CDL15_Pgr016496 [Punica granatum]|uniref:Uncharacterized protein n=1 Tax=Punica granatum TaxID=22663 RepID=A0A218WJW2_PUNGR|nr:hypothetical protein CDL15_Pgr016496 [Punica granatum]